MIILKLWISENKVILLIISCLILSYFGFISLMNLSYITVFAFMILFLFNYISKWKKISYLISTKEKLNKIGIHNGLEYIDFIRSNGLYKTFFGKYQEIHFTEKMYREIEKIALDMCKNEYKEICYSRLQTLKKDLVSYNKD